MKGRTQIEGDWETKFRGDNLDAKEGESDREL